MRTMQPKELSDEQVKLLQEPLPKEALKPHPTKSFLTTINPAYVIERMNQVFGTGKWSQVSQEIITTGKFIVLKCSLDVPEYGISISTYGGNDNADLGDAYKGAQTDAFTKAASMLGIGLHVWKDEKVSPMSPSPRRAEDVTPVTTVLGGTIPVPRRAEYTIPETGQDASQEKHCPSCGLPMKLVPAGISKAGKEYNAFFACNQCKTTLSPKK